VNTYAIGMFTDLVDGKTIGIIGKSSIDRELIERFLTERGGDVAWSYSRLEDGIPTRPVEVVVFGGETEGLPVDSVKALWASMGITLLVLDDLISMGLSIS